MKTLPYLIFLFSLLALGQNSELKVTNPGPRIGEDFEITYRLLPKDYKKPGPLDDPFQMKNPTIGTGTIMITNNSLEPGLKKYGPFTFNIDGQTITTNTIEVMVYPAIPKEFKDGVWIRIIEFDNKNHLVVEQRISQQWQKENANTIAFGQNTPEYISLNKEKFCAKGLIISSSNSRSESQVIDENDIFGNGMVQYFRNTFEFEKTEDFKKKFKLDEKFFDNFPQDIELEDVFIE